MERDLNLGECKAYKSIKPLQYLSNIFKHNVPIEPDEELLQSLDMDTSINYCEIYESTKFREDLATFVGLSEDSDYCQITERYVDIATEFMEDVEQRNKDQLSMVEGEPVRLDQFCE